MNNGNNGNAKHGNDGGGGNRPAAVLRYGSLKCAIWRNVTNDAAARTLYNATFTRSYKDADDNWKDSGSFGVDDLLVVAKLADEAFEWIARQQAEDRRTASEQDDRQAQSQPNQQQDRRRERNPARS